MNRFLSAPRLTTNLLKQLRRISTPASKIPKNIENDSIASDDIHLKIIYSSFLEDGKVKLGYKRNRSIQEARRKWAQKELFDRVDVKPFPSAISSLVSDANLPVLQANPLSYGESRKATAIRREMPDNWMQDYEFYDEEEDEEADDEGQSKSGTPDPSIPPSKIPCNGCGAVLHCANSGLPGYIPSEIFRDRTDKELKTIICQRCHFLKNYNIALDVAVSPQDYIETLRTIETKHALAVLIVDLLDFPCSIWPGIQEILGPKRPIVIVGNKVDLLPRDSQGYLNRIKDCLTNSLIDSGIDRMNIKHISLISAKTGYGIEELITQLHKIWKYDGDVYLVGCTNVGKSSLFNALLRSDYCKVQANDLIQKATTCPWPGTTLQMLKFPILRPSDVRLFYRFKRLFSENERKHAEEKLRREQFKMTGKTEYATLIGHIGRTFSEDDDTADPFSMSKGTNPILTLNEKSKEFVNSKWCYDTPGVIHPDQILHLLTTEEIIKVIPNEIIKPRMFLMKPGMSLFLAGLGRLCFMKGNVKFIRVSVFASSELPVLITETKDADDIYRKLCGTEYLAVPLTDEIRKRKWPGLQCSIPITVTGEVDGASTCDILLSSAGWLGIELPIGESCTFRAWTPEKRGIRVRNPALISYTSNFRGSRIRGSLAYKTKLSQL